MGNGRWIKQPNGDYQHFTDEEIEEQNTNKLIAGAGICLAAGPIIMLCSLHDTDGLLAGGILTAGGLIGLILHPKEVLGMAIVCGILAGLGWFFIFR